MESLTSDGLYAGRERGKIVKVKNSKQCKKPLMHAAGCDQVARYEVAEEKDKRSRMQCNWSADFWGLTCVKLIKSSR